MWSKTFDCDKQKTLNNFIEKRKEPQIWNISTQIEVNVKVTKKSQKNKVKKQIFDPFIETGWSTENMHEYLLNRFDTFPELLRILDKKQKTKYSNPFFLCQFKNCKNKIVKIWISGTLLNTVNDYKSKMSEYENV